MTSHDILRTYFGYDSFRGGQEELVNAILAGQDVLGIMPTGAGKSLCYQLPALMQEGVTLVVSPLISLMKDQVDALNQAGIPAAYLNSSLSRDQMDATLDGARLGQYKLLYVAPERLVSYDFLTFVQQTRLSLLAVDEAHCISQWGQDFRPSYGQIPQFINKLPHRPTVAAFTATATPRVKEDIGHLLALQSPKVLTTGFDRENLYFEVQMPPKKPAALLQFLRTQEGRTGIVYCTTRKTVEEVCALLQESGLSALAYHGGLSDDLRRENQEAFLYDRIQVMVATNAFGMGIDKSNVSFVVHYNLPKDMESYYQEAGRAGRDGSDAHCLLLYSPQDVRTLEFMMNQSPGSADPQLNEQLRAAENQRLRDMTFYATGQSCLRASILRYFGETPPDECGHCSNCKGEFETIDVTEEAQKMLSCVARLRERFGITMVIDVLRGSKNQRILDMGFDKLSTYGISKKSAQELRQLGAYLLSRGYLEKDAGQYGTVFLTAKAKGLLRGEERLTMKRVIGAKSAPPPQVAEKLAMPPERKDLYAALRDLRYRVATDQGVPAFVVFSDKSLQEMCLHLPLTPVEFLYIHGVGTAKLGNYGEEFLSCIEQYCRENDLIPPAHDEGVSCPTAPEVRPEIVASIPASLSPEEVFHALPLSREPLGVSALCMLINAGLGGSGEGRLSPVKLSQWLLMQGYLQKEDGTGPMPSQQGFDAGIIREYRTGGKEGYWMNLYPLPLQEMILDRLEEIFTWEP